MRAKVQNWLQCGWKGISTLLVEISTHYGLSYGPSREVSVEWGCGLWRSCSAIIRRSGPAGVTSLEARACPRPAQGPLWIQEDRRNSSVIVRGAQ